MDLILIKIPVEYSNDFFFFKIPVEVVEIIKMAVKSHGKSKGLACPSKKNKPGEFTSPSMENFYYKLTQ